MLKSKVATCLLFDGQAEEAARFYTSLIPNSSIGSILRPDPNGPAIMVEFTLDGIPYQALNGGPKMSFSEVVSISVKTDDQEETDRYWKALIADGGQESQCAWLKDRFGLSWQIVPRRLIELLNDSDREAAGRVMQTMLTMRKIVIADIEAAYRGLG